MELGPRETGKRFTSEEINDSGRCTTPLESTNLPNTSQDDCGYSPEIACQPDPKKTIDFLKYVSDTKNLKRTGWVLRGLKDAETVACHMYRMALMAMVLTPQHLDRDRCIRMALVHDLAESIVGDITPQCGISREEKHHREAQAMQQILSTISGTTAADELNKLWHEYEECSTDESKYVHSLDKLEFALQASEYELQYGCRWDDFFANTDSSITEINLRKIFEEILQRRQFKRQ